MWSGPYFNKWSTTNCELLNNLQFKFGERVEILAGSGIHVDNIETLRERTGIHQFHGSCKIWKKDPTTTLGNISYAYHEKDDYDCVSTEIVRQIKSIPYIGMDFYMHA